MIAFLWVCLSFIAAVIYRKSRTGFWGTFILSLFLSPLLPVIIYIFTPTTAPALDVNNKKVKRQKSFMNARVFDEDEPLHPSHKG